MDIVAVVPTFNRRELLERAVNSVLNQTAPPAELLVLNNGCTDGTEQYLQALLARSQVFKTKITVFKNIENTGASSGMGFLFRKALELNPSWIWVIDDDGFCFPDALEKLLRCKEYSQPETYILQSLVEDEKGQWPAENRPALFNKEEFQFYGLDEKVREQTAAVPVNTGGYFGLLIKKQALEEFGFPREDFYLWYDDIEFVVRVSQKKKVYLIPGSRLQHFGKALVPHKNVWPFSGPLPLIPKEHLWRYYYLNRNVLSFAKQHLSSKKFLMFWLKQSVRNLSAPFLLRQGSLKERLSMAFQASRDGFFERMGKREFKGF